MTKTSPNTALFSTMIFLGVLCFVALPCTGFSETIINSGVKWQTAGGQNAVILYQEAGDLIDFNSKIKYPAQAVKQPDVSKPPASAAAERVDILFERAKNLLGMHGFVNQIKIRLYKDKDQLKKAYYEIYKSQSDVRAWYTHKELTVYIQLEDLHEGMLAHELAHAVIDHYLMVPPPHETAEILARYVDSKLHADTTDPVGQSPKSLSVQGFSDQ